MAEYTAELKDGRSVNFDYEFGDTLQATLDLFGEKIVHDYALRGLVVAAQGRARGLLKAGKISEDEIRAEMAKWKPGEARVVKSAAEKIRELSEKLSPEERAQLLKEIKAQKAA